ncbi:hemerythrin domain-containing protein [Sandaracinus amylolyticus]|uniref:hemerythrin domain-containing protein n=1 Tax=Sandaracinus amylolyticus TaxID=927083 RepID=UPI001F15CA7D|nr:hemerythrin domain-containing protein [Sandaracinus amylolyticus]UJR86477.1 Hypothetical protein I5071_85720 [Sandaracinus amylolyticus]
MTDAAPIVKSLLEDHARIDALLSRLANEAQGEVRPKIETTWDALERALLRHLDEEEVYLFPELAKERPEDAARLASDHARFRHALGEIGIALELHAVRSEVIDALARDLRAHAAQEDVALYRWAAASEAPGPRAFVSRMQRRLAA